MSTLQLSNQNNNVLSSIKSNNYPLLGFKLNKVKASEIKEEELENTYVDIEGWKENQLSDTAISVNYVGSVSEYKGKVSFTIQPIDTSINDDNSINIEYNVMATEDFYDSEMYCDLLRLSVNNVTNSILEESSNDFGMEFGIGNIKVNPYLFPQQ